MIWGRTALELLGFQGLRERGSEGKLASDRLKVPLMFPIISPMVTRLVCAPRERCAHAADPRPSLVTTPTFGASWPFWTLAPFLLLVMQEVSR